MKTPTLVITFLLIFTMSGLSFAKEEPPPDPPDAHCISGPAVFILIVAAVGVYMGLKLKGFCKKHLPPSPPTPPPTTPPPPPCTNCPATNTPPRLAMLDDSGADYWDIAEQGWLDTEGYLYSALVHATIEGSTNLVDWDRLMSLKAWCSVSNVLTVVYDGAGVAVSTNYSRTGTNGIVLGQIPAMGGQPAQMQFFRLKTPL